MLVPAPGLRGELECALVGEIGLHESHPPQLAGVDRSANLPDPGHQPRAVADRHRDAVSCLKGSDLDPLLESAGDRFLRVDVLACLRDLERERQMLLVWNRQQHAANRAIGQHGGKIGRRRDAEFAREGLPLLLGAAIGRHDLELRRLRRGAREHLGPAAKPDDSDFDCVHGWDPVASSSERSMLTIRLMAGGSTSTNVSSVASQSSNAARSRPVSCPA